MRILYNRNIRQPITDLPFCKKENRPPKNDGLSDLFSLFNRSHIETGDLLLLTVVLLLYTETKDTDYLFLLAALFFCL